MTGAGDCHRQDLSQAGCFRVQRCECGHVHVTVGPVTVRLTPEALRDFAAVLRAATEAMPAPRAAWQRRTAPGGAN